MAQPIESITNSSRLFFLFLKAGLTFAYKYILGIFFWPFDMLLDKFPKAPAPLRNVLLLLALIGAGIRKLSALALIVSLIHYTGIAAEQLYYLVPEGYRSLLLISGGLVLVVLLAPFIKLCLEIVEVFLPFGIYLGSLLTICFVAFTIFAAAFKYVFVE